jgi:tryptophan synthase alpha chain
VAAASSGFVYYVSRTGVTGERAALPSDLIRDVKKLRKRLGLPLAVGFGISTPEQVEAVGEIANGVVVGSALVRLVEEKGNDPELPALLEDRVRDLAAPLRLRAERRRA